MSKTTLLFLTIFIEGYVVLACELLAIRLLIPFVGSGTETISIVISAVLLPLAIGYHAGGLAFRRHYRFTRARGRRHRSVRRLLLRNILLALFVLALGLSYVLMESFFGFIASLGVKHRIAQTTLYSLAFLVAPIYLLGQTVPLVSHYFSRRKLSEITGRMLFFSTVGAFLGSVFSTIVLMTALGVHNTVIVTLGLLALLAVLLAGRSERYAAGAALLLLAAVWLLNNDGMMRSLGIVSNNAYNVARVVELPHQEARILNLNRSDSSKLARNPKKNFEYLQYIDRHFIRPLQATGVAHEILVLGAGGFTVGLRDTVNRYSYVDIDPELKEVSEKHFLREKLGANKRFIPMSARAFVRSDARTYDLIVVDAYTNVYSIPMESITREFLLDVKSRLNPNGIVIANVIMSPIFEDRFSVRYNNTFASVFPAYTRIVINPFSPRPDLQVAAQNPLRLNNVLYIYFNTPLADDRTVYTDDRNTYSLDR